jgi:hypothetical protein
MAGAAVPIAKRVPAPIELVGGVDRLEAEHHPDAFVFLVRID